MPTQASATRGVYLPRTYSQRTKARFRLDRVRRLVKHLGGNPTDVQWLLIERLVEVEWSILRLSARADAGDLSQHAAREMLAFHNHLRLITRELGLRPAEPKPPTLDEIAAQVAAERRDMTATNQRAPSAAG